MLKRGKEKPKRVGSRRQFHSIMDQPTQWIHRQLRTDGLILLLILGLGLIFFLDHVHWQLASDDIAWLQGGTPTVFDRYRYLPRLFFTGLDRLWGPNMAPALTMTFLFHSLNAWLINCLGHKLLKDRVSALIAAAVLMINPITLSTLTWISCFSYVLGTSFALLALLLFWRSSGARDRDRFWSAVGALLAFGAGLLCTHEIFFLPLIFLSLAWYQGNLRHGMILGAVGTALAGGVNAWIYHFEQYGIEASRLFSFDFALAYTSSALSSGLALAFAYLLSFMTRTLGFLQVSFIEPVRWGMTALALVGGILSFCRNRDRRLVILFISFVVMITPYILRLYLTPDTVNYHPSYALSGRVFYLPFTLVALALGWAISTLCRCIQGRRLARFAWLIPLIAYGHALWLYKPADFLGLNVTLQDLPQAVPPRWNPYMNPHPAWSLLAGLSVLGVVAWPWWKKVKARQIILWMCLYGHEVSRLFPIVRRNRRDRRDRSALEKESEGYSDSERCPQSRPAGHGDGRPATAALS